MRKLSVETVDGLGDLLLGQWLSGRVCRHCGHPPDDFADEETVVSEAAPISRNEE